MLELRPGCECCDRDLPPDSTEAMICSFECTFCRGCGDGVLAGRWSQLRRRTGRAATRPAQALARFPASTKRIHKPAGCSAAP